MRSTQHRRLIWRPALALALAGSGLGCQAAAPAPMTTTTYTVSVERQAAPAIDTPERGAPTPAAISQPTGARSATITPNTSPTNAPSDGAAAEELQWNRPNDSPADPGPPSHFSAVSFVSPDIGWALGPVPTPDGHGRSAYTLGLTRDGGRSWEARRLPDRGIACLDGVVDILFLDDRNGWLRCDGLLHTTDGALTWELISDRDPIRTWGRTINGLVWAWIEDPDHDAAVMAPRPGGLDAWRPLVTDWPNQAGPDPERPWITISIWDEQTLVFHDSLTTGSPWWATHDGGVTWKRLTRPCGQHDWPFESIALGSPTDLWAACGGVAATSMQTKLIATSVDGGATWALRAEAALPGSETAGASVEWIALSGRFWAIRALSPTVLVAELSRSRGPLLSADGGATWDRLDPGRCAGVDELVPSAFIDAEHGWLWSRHGFAHTDDGGRSWLCLAYPQS